MTLNMASKTDLKVEPIKDNIGARIDIDRSTLVDPDVAGQCLALLEQYGVLVFPRIGIDDDEQLAFTDLLGPRVDYTDTVPGGSAAAANVYKLTLDPKINDEPEGTEATFFWHFDGYHLLTPPPKATLLSARRIPERGAQTDFANTYIAYEELPQEEKDEIEGLKAWHTTVASYRQIKEFFTEADLARLRTIADNLRRAAATSEDMPTLEPGSYDDYGTLLPVVWTHKDGRRSLLLGQNADRIEGMSRTIGRAILTRLLEWTVQPAFSYRHNWEIGDLLIWNNQGVLHRALPYDRTPDRVMHRTTVAGAELFQ